MVLFESIVDVEAESELRRLPVPLIICQLPTLNDEEDSCLCRNLDATGTVTGEVRLVCGVQIIELDTSDKRVLLK